MTVVLDSWAVLELLGSTGRAARSVRNLLERARPLMSWVNVGEVFYVVCRRHGEEAAGDVVRDLRGRVDLTLPDERLVLAAATIKADHAMAYADAFAAALAVERDAELWTGDPELLVEGAPWRTRDLRS